jgi:phenylacetic acid degradation operon negative regulatory protein
MQSSVPDMSRRHAARPESARGLLFTVLGELVLPGGGSAWTSAFIGVLARLGVEEKASRQALMRTAADGWLASERVGRRTRWQLTAEAERLLAEGRERIYGLTGSVPQWDGRWLLALARAPETDRPARHVLRTLLSRAGFGSPAPGVWISTHAERIDEVERVLGEAGVLDGTQIFVAEYHGGGDLESMISRAWNLDAIDESYREFIDEFAVAETGDPLARLVDLVHCWRRFPWIDPGLPSDLLPARWSGEQAAGLFAKTHAIWADAATAEWMRLNRPGTR